MIENIPTHVIAGPLGAGKTTLLRQLLGQRPQHEQWGILINEFGQIGIDAALLAADAQGVSLAEVPGGCLCCVNGLPFQVGLSRLLRKARPTRLFIEASGLGHPLELQKQLAAPPWQGVLALQPLVMVLDAGRLASGARLADAQQRALPEAGLLVLNKSGHLDQRARRAVEALLPDCTKQWCDQADIPFDRLPAREAAPSAPARLPPDSSAAARLLPLWRSTTDWHCITQSLDAYYSIGWRIHPDQQFDLDLLHRWLATHPWMRAKGVVHSARGWVSFNALPGEIIAWQPTARRQDNRIELITAHRPDQAALHGGLRAVAGND
ncbi:MAG: GTP-binding protein [Halopseudomonas sp.]